MKKTFLAKRNAILSLASASWGVSALAFAIIVLLVRLLLPNVFWYVTTPVFRISNATAETSHAFFARFSDTAALALKNEELQKENTALANENQALIKKEESLSAMLGTGAAPRSGAAGILASIVSRPPESPYDTLLVSAGSDDGVVLGMEAFSSVPVGIVTEIMKKFSRITLFSAPRMSVNGWVGHANVPVSIRGEGGGAMSAIVARSASIVASDIVYAPGPGMLPIGAVTRIDSDSSSPSVMLHIQSAVNLFAAGWVILRDTGRVPALFETP